MDIILKYFPKLPADQLEKMEALRDLYEDWNQKINVISRKDMESLYEKHVLHSLSIYKFLPFQPGSKILDLGTGGGFPGIPLAIVMPQVKFHLVDSIGKKIKVVEGVAESLNLANVTASHSRVEQVKGQYDFVVSRAVAELKLLIQWVNGKVSDNQINGMPNGLICLKGGDLKEELKAVNRYKEVHELSGYFSEEFFETKKLVYVGL